MFGVVLKLYQILCPFVIRTVMIYVLGMEYVGLNTLFNSILQVLNMTELGVGTAMVFSMYKPIADDDTETIQKLMNLYRTYYRIIGLLIAIIGVAITPLVPRLIADTSAIGLNLYYLYWLNLFYTVLSYWFFAYKGSILQAHQRTDIASKIMLVSNTCMYVAQISLLLLFKNYYYYLLGLLLGQALTSSITAIVVDKYYPQYKPKGKFQKHEIASINQRVKDLFTAKVGGVVQSSADSIVISTFLGLTALAQYNNYYYIMNSVFGFILLLFNSCLAGIGNSMVLDSKEKNYNDFLKITFLTEWIIIFCSSCFLCIYQPFIKLWVGDDNVLPFGIVVCLVLYFYFITTNQMLCLYKDAAGIWHKDRYRPLVTALVNLFLNLALVKYLGLYGIVMSTVISLAVVGMPWLIRNLFQDVFERKSTEFIKYLVNYFIILVCSCVITFMLCSKLPGEGLINIVYRLIVCLLIPNLLLLVITSKTKLFAEALALVDQLFGKKLSRITVLNKLLHGGK